MDYPEGVLTPQTPGELADALGSAGAGKKTVVLAGASSKCLMAGPVEPAEATITTTGLRRVLQYEPGDLTISVEAGLNYCELTRLLARNRQMIPLDPPFSGTATIGGVVAANSSGPRRRLYGTARDLIIGMKFATLEGKLVESGGMVVKNVAGLDMSKLMIGSFGTLAAIAVVNFKLIPCPPGERSFVIEFASVAESDAARNAVLQSVLQPAALDWLTPAAAPAGAQGHTLAVRVGGNPAVIDRYQRELTALGRLRAIEGEEQTALWSHVENFTPRYLAEHADGAVVRVSATLKELPRVLEAASGPAIARAGSGVCYVYFPQAEAAAAWLAEAIRRGWKAVLEFAPADRKRNLDLWPAPGNDFQMIKRVKQMMDPNGLLNRGRLYGRI